MPELKVAVIADLGQVQKFGRDALDAIEGCEEVTVYSCTNTGTRKHVFRHGAYYALNLLAVRNECSRMVPVSGGAKRIARRIEFASGYDGAWQVLPPGIVEDMRAAGFDVVIKLGMGLLRVPDPEIFSAPILSYHHGDPDHYRGRPAAFWEIVDGRPLLGQIVQIIGNRLDAGAVVAFAQTKVHAYSYRATLIQAYRHSPLIINEAIRNALAGAFLPKPCKGRNWRLPSNLTVANFVLRMAARFIGRLLYGAFIEKKWQVATAPAPKGGPVALFEDAVFPPPAQWRTLAPARPYCFYADPFYSSDPPGILVEGLNRCTGLGEIVLVADGNDRRVSEWRGHASYPATVTIGGRQIVVPETASSLAPAAYAIEDGVLTKLFDLEVEGGVRILDPTLLIHDGRLYLFGNDRAIGSNALFLWSAESLDARFRKHPLSPVLISPEGGRMGGSIVHAGRRLIRLGQDFRSGYGQGLCAFDIAELTAERYCERRLGSITFAHCRGPHTLNARDGELLFDFYQERLALLAGWRRILARLRRRSSPD